jgi:hypothetical protein
MEANGVVDLAGSMLMIKKIPITSGLAVLLSAKRRET